MRHLPILLSAVLASLGLLAVSEKAQAAMPTLSIDRSAVADQPVEKAGYYYRRRWGYYPYYGYRPYYRPYGYYYRPYGYGYYGYGRPYYRYRY
ncbi:MAG TPA: hypothetical protein VLD66_01830 [Methyloceanibacter sp.]|nr:hypothetical protein [Methyloceanibacter sp.]HSB58319.1 hypothetical protein [Methyloceanibacter sp.]